MITYRSDPTRDKNDCLKVRVDWEKKELTAMFDGPRQVLYTLTEVVEEDDIIVQTAAVAPPKITRKVVRKGAKE
jgi:hypothetical protein